MIEFGKTLRETREARGYSVSQLAEVTHILPQIIENLEKEDFSRIVAPIYGRGFVKLYCETVGLDPVPFVTEFMEIYNGNRPPVIRMKDAEDSNPMSQPPSIHDVSPEVPIIESVPTDQDPDEQPAVQKLSFPSEHPTLNFEPLPEPPQATGESREHPIREPKPFTSGSDDLPFPPNDMLEQQRDYRLPGHAIPEVPRSFWRFGILLAAAVIICAVIFFSCRAIYHATMLTSADQKTEERQTPDLGGQKQRADENRTNKPQTVTPRKHVSVPPLYID